MNPSRHAQRLTRRRLLIGTVTAFGAVSLLSACAPTTSPAQPAAAPTQSAAAKPPAAAQPTTAAPAAAPKTAAAATFSFWNGLTGADGNVMDELIERFTKEKSITIEQQRAQWPDLYAKLQVSVPAGEGPDLMLMHPTEIPHFSVDEIIDAIDDKALEGNGFKGEDYLEAPWNGGTFDGKRYGIPLDVPQHVLYMNNKVLKDAGLMGSDGQIQAPTTRDELVDMAKKVTQGEVFGFALGTLDIGRYTFGFHNLLWQNGANVFTPDLKRSALDQPAAIEVAEFWASVFSQLRIAPPGNANARDAFTAHKVGFWIAGSWNFTGLRAANVEFTAAPLPKIFNQPVVWTTPHQFTFPKSKTRDAGREQAAWTFMRWITDNVVDWTLNAGQMSAHKKPHQDQRITGDPFFKTLAGQASNWQLGQMSPKWVKAENLTRPIIEEVYIGSKQPKPAMEELAKAINALPD
jgi:multiple sugar transport system substrate-binding protein